MAKVLRSVSNESDVKKLPEMKRAMQQDALAMQGVSSRLQIKEEKRRLSEQLVQQPSNTKRLKKPNTESEFISAPVGLGRMSKSNVQAMKREDFSKKADALLCGMQTPKSDDGLTF